MQLKPIKIAKKLFISHYLSTIRKPLNSILNIIKPYFKQNKTTGERYTVYKLCGSYRLNGGIHHRIIIGFGRLEELETVEQKKLLAARIEDMLINRGNVLPCSEVDEKVEQLARHFTREILQKGRYDVKSGNRELEMVDMSTLRNKDAREIGAE